MPSASSSPSRACTWCCRMPTRSCAGPTAGPWCHTRCSAVSSIHGLRGPGSIPVASIAAGAALLPLARRLTRRGGARRSSRGRVSDESLGESGPGRARPAQVVRRDRRSSAASTWKCAGPAPRTDRANGAGKSTLFNLICGRFGPTAGEILLSGQRIAALTPHEINRWAWRVVPDHQHLPAPHRVREPALRRALGDRLPLPFWNPGRLRANERAEQLLERCGSTAARPLAMTYSEQRSLEMA